MQRDSLAEIVDTLTPEQQTAVREFIDFLKTGAAPRENRFSAAVSEFLDEHRDLLRRPSRSDLLSKRWRTFSTRTIC